MAAAEVQQQPAEPASALPDYVTSPNAVLGDSEAKWRYGRAPDYSKTRKVWAETKRMNHVAGSLPEIVENLVKNWEVEASFKTDLKDWRTVDHENYTFAMNGGPPQTGEHMLKVGTYNAIIAPNEYYSPNTSDFASSHKTFKRMMPTFAWEVLEVYSGPPEVAFRWRHWGTMQNDYVGFNDKGEKVTAKAHGGTIDIQGVTVAKVNDKLQVQSLMTWFDPLDMFRQIAPGGVVNKEVVPRRAGDQSQTDAGVPAQTPASGEASKPTNTTTQGQSAPSSEQSIRQQKEEHDEEEHADVFHDAEPTFAKEMQTKANDAIESVKLNKGPDNHDSPTNSSSDESSWTKVSEPNTEAPEAATTMPANSSIYSSSVTGAVEPKTEQDASEAKDAVDEILAKPAGHVHPHPKDMESAVQPTAGEAVMAKPESEETKQTFDEMSKMTPTQCPFMNRE